MGLNFTKTTIWWLPFRIHIFHRNLNFLNLAYLNQPIVRLWQQNFNPEYFPPLGYLITSSTIVNMQTTLNSRISASKEFPYFWFVWGECATLILPTYIQLQRNPNSLLLQLDNYMNFLNFTNKYRWKFFDVQGTYRRPLPSSKK